MKITRTHRFLFKLIVFVASYSYIGYKLYEFVQKGNSFAWSEASLILILPVFFFMILNWSAEALKWRFLVSGIEKVAFIKAFMAVLSGITISIFTPNRIGEFGGRIMVLKSENRKSAIGSTLVGSYAQAMVTIIFGLMAYAILVLYFPEKLGFVNILSTWSIWLVFSASVVFMWFYFRMDLVAKLSERFHFRWSSHIRDLKTQSKGMLLSVLILSMVRYCIFTTQFFILLQMFGVGIGFAEAFTGIALSYFFAFFIPKFMLVEVGVRGSVALFALGLFTNNEVGILSAVFVLWVVNLVIPSIAGSIIWSKMKI